MLQGERKRVSSATPTRAGTLSQQGRDAGGGSLLPQLCSSEGRRSLGRGVGIRCGQQSATTL